MLQNTMAYGEEGAAMIEETPRPRKPQKEVKPEVEIDRFDEGWRWVLLVEHCYFHALNQKSRSSELRGGRGAMDPLFAADAVSYDVPRL